MAPLPTSDVRGVPLRYREKGSGDPLVFIHGSVGDLEDFSAHFDLLSDHFRCITYTRRYHDTDRRIPVGASYAMEEHADDLEALCKALRIENPHILSSSWGGYIALLLLTRNPGFCRSIVLGEPPMLPFLRDLDDGQPLADAFDRDAIIPARTAFAGGNLREGLELFMGGIRGSRSSFAMLPEVIRERLFRFAPELKLELETEPRVYMPPISREQLDAIRTPALVLSGAQSPRLFQRIAEGLSVALPRATLLTVPGAGHIMHAGNPLFYYDAVLTFLQKGIAWHDENLPDDAVRTKPSRSF